MFLDVFNGPSWSKSGQKLNGTGRGGSCQMLNGAERVKARLNPTYFDLILKVHKIICFIIVYGPLYQPTYIYNNII